VTPNLPTQGGETEAENRDITATTHQNRSGPPQANSTQTNGRRAQTNIGDKRDGSTAAAREERSKRQPRRVEPVMRRKPLIASPPLHDYMEVKKNKYLLFYFSKTIKLFD
jgi:hypothetical protein